jgi:hypothetical protein
VDVPESDETFVTNIALQRHMIIFHGITSLPITNTGKPYQSKR